MNEFLHEIIENKTRIEIIEERFDRHLISMEKMLEKLSSKIDALQNEIFNMRIDAANTDAKYKIKFENISGRLKVLFFVLSSSSGIIGGIIVELIRYFLKLKL